MVFCLPSKTAAARWMQDDDVLDGLPQEKRSIVKPAASEGNQAARGLALEELRQLLDDHKIDVYVVPSEDEHLSEYPSPADRRLRFLTGFTGSAGTALVSRSTAKLYVDSRYWIMAPQQVSKAWSVKRVGDGKQAGWAAELLTSTDEALRVGIDPRLISAGAGGAHSASVGPLLAADHLTIVPIRHNLIDKIWIDQPARSSSLIELHPLDFAGKRAAVKLQELPTAPVFEGPGVNAAGMLVSALDEIAWLLNLRGVDDVPMTPVFYAYLWLPIATQGANTRANKRTLFIDLRKLSMEVRDYLETLDIDLLPYDEVWTFLSEVVKKDLAVVGDKKPASKVFTGLAISWAVQLALGENNIRSVLSPIAEAKAVKNTAEIAGFKAAYLRDGRATVRWMARMERLIRKEGKQIDEHEATVLHTSYRAREAHYRGPAYGDISGSGPNGALPHYEPEAGRCRTIDRETPYVNDSGPQYRDGTIDTTRTLHYGSPTAEQKAAYTRVLQGHLAVIRTVFPEGRGGQDFNTLARAPLWQSRLDFGHGVGHGIGAYGGVHEGPEGIGAGNAYPLKAGHVVTCEPGYYKEGRWGIRIESAILCVELEPSTDGKPAWLGWEILTRVPIATNLVDFSLLAPVERQWLKDHNALCCKALLPLLDGPGDAEARCWLKKQ